MHNHDAMAFSEASEALLHRLEPEERTEPQAHRFADLFLVPTSLLEGLSRSEDVADFFDVPIDCARRRLERVMDDRRRQHARSFTGEACPKCANFTLVRNGNGLKCATCAEAPDWLNARKSRAIV